MPDLKISQLTSATTPLAGTEVLPIVQSSTTVKVAVSDLTAGRSVSASALTASSGNLTFSGTAQRITGDFSNATWANRLAFQTSTVNGNTSVPVLPNGTGTASQIALFGNSDPTNASYAQLLQIGATETRLTAAIQGTGTYTPLTFYTGGSERVRIDTSGNVGIGTASPTDSASYTGKVLDVAGPGYFRQNGDATKYVSIGTSSGTTYLQANGTGNQLAIYTVGSERMRIDASGNVGIGTASPSSYGRLGVMTPTANNGFFGIANSAGGAGGVQMAQYYSTVKISYIDTTLTNGTPGSETAYLAFATANSGTLAERMRITAAGNIVAGASAALATTATDGFLYVPTCAGLPTGTPTTITGMAPIVVDTTNNKLYFYSGGAWRDAGP